MWGRERVRDREMSTSWKSKDSPQHNGAICWRAAHRTIGGFGADSFEDLQMDVQKFGFSKIF